MRGTVRALHRPLAHWVARLDPADHERGSYRITGPVNDGAERSDARTLPLFQNPAWRRVNLSAGRDNGPTVQALALRHSTTDTVYVELDDYGRPLPATTQGTDLIARIEQNWAAPPTGADVLHVLEGESRDLRHALLHRLAVETDPPAVLYHALPWTDLDAVATNVLAMLDGTGPVEPPANELRHWFTPAAKRVAGPLAVLERGMREERGTESLRHEAASLLTGLLAAPPARIPTPTAQRLARLAERLSARDPLLRHTARVVSARLHTSPVGRSPSLSLRLDPVLPAAARTTGATYRKEARDERFEFRAEHTPGGRVRVTLTLPADSEQGPWAAVEHLVAPVSVRTADSEPRRVWIALRSRDASLVGVLNLFAPPDRFELVADEPVVPFERLGTIPANELLPSLRASSTATKRIWVAAAETLPADHSVRLALRLHRDSSTS